MNDTETMVLLNNQPDAAVCSLFYSTATNWQCSKIDCI